MGGRVFVAGNCNIDITLPIDVFPNPGTDRILGGAQITPGGKGLNQSVAAQKAGAPVTLFSAIGTDSVSDWLLQQICEYQINVDLLQRVETTTSDICATILEPTGRNTMLGSGNAIRLLDAKSLTHQRLTPKDVVLAGLTCPDHVIDALLTEVPAKGARLLINASPGTRNFSTVNENVVFILNAREMSEHHINSMLPNNNLLLVTNGAAGVDVISPDGSIQEFAAPNIDTVVDTTGAGDCFAGWVAGRLAQGDEIDLAVREAVIAASLSVASVGTTPSYPDRQIVLARA